MDDLHWSLFLTVTIFLQTCNGWSDWHEPHCVDNRHAIVHLFEWKWSDIAAECERFLSPMGFCGVQVSPATENAVIYESYTERPWWERYQPASYILGTRSGTEQEFAQMVETCNRHDVRIYVDAVVNHMTGGGRVGTGTAGSPYDGDTWTFPGVPYDETNFNDCENCPGGCCCINAWQDHEQVRNCQLSGLIDLDQSIPDTADKIVELFNRMNGYGVAGYRIDAAKHMWPHDLEAIWNSLDDLRANHFGPGEKPYFYLEVLDMDQQGEVNVWEYNHLGMVTEFRYCSKVMEAAASLWSIPGVYDPGWNMLSSEDAFVFVDNHDNQRGHGSGSDVVTHTDPRKYKIAQAITLGWDYGQPRVMSSFYFGDDSERGPPADQNENILDVEILPDGSCGNGWVCEHRWTAVAGMVGFAKATRYDSAEDFWSEGNQAAWRRGNNGFVAISNEVPLTRSFYTGLPEGYYCNVIEGPATTEGCTGQTVYVDGFSNAMVDIQDNDNPIFAIHIEAQYGTGGEPPVPPTTTIAPDTSFIPDTTIIPESTAIPESTIPDTTLIPDTTIIPESTLPPQPTSTVLPDTITPGATTQDPVIPDVRRTIIYMRAYTQVGQDLFLRGGIGHDHRPGCTEDPATSACAIDISHNSLGDTGHYDAYNAWRVGDTRLNWYGVEEGQGSYQGQPAEGTPTAWTTNDPGHEGYQPDNRWGPDAWKVDLQMNCSETINGWFELKGYGNSGIGWESDVYQTMCTGTVGGTPPDASQGNHLALCGHFNVFIVGQADCIIDEL